VIAVQIFLLLAAPSRQETRLHQVLDRVADRCRLPPSVFRLDKGGHLHFSPASSAPHRDVDCALVQLRKRGLSDKLPFAFVGNETDGRDVKP
jgi:hypothetical protein